jgi:hypothetical protein
LRKEEGESGKIRVLTYDLENFFTNIDRNKFRGFVREGLDEILQRHPGVKFF